MKGGNRTAGLLFVTDYCSIYYNMCGCNDVKTSQAPEPEQEPVLPDENAQVRDLGLSTVGVVSTLPHTADFNPYPPGLWV